jgi:hypothetical protein
MVFIKGRAVDELTGKSRSYLAGAGWHTVMFWAGWWQLAAWPVVAAAVMHGLR